MSHPNKSLSPDQSAALLQVLRTRFENNMQRHAGLTWAPIQARLESMPEQLWSLDEMEASDGEPDVIGQDPTSGAYIFCDCAAESPKGRRSICYDQAALDGRKENKPRHSAVGMAEEMGVTIMDEATYRHLQTLGSFDLKTSSWVHTPDDVRKLGGALFCDRRFGKVFVYHNGAESYYAARAFRGVLRV